MINEYNFSTGGQQGWICPKCGKVLAPWMSECSCYRNSTITTTTTPIGEVPQTIKPNPYEEWWKQYITGMTAASGSDYWDNTTKTWTNILKNVQNDGKGI